MAVARFSQALIHRHICRDDSRYTQGIRDFFSYRVRGACSHNKVSVMSFCLGHEHHCERVRVRKYTGALYRLQIVNRLQCTNESVTTNPLI